MTFSSRLRTTWRFCTCSGSTFAENQDDELKATSQAAFLLGTAPDGLHQAPVSKEAIPSPHMSMSPPVTPHTDSESKVVFSRNEVKFVGMVGKVDEQLALLALPCELLTRNLSITFDQLSKWSEAMLEQDGLHYARHVIPTLVLFLRSTYPVDFTQWLLELARDRWDYTSDRRFLALQVLHNCIPSNHRPAIPDSGRSPNGYYHLIASTLSSLLSLSSVLSLQQTMTDSIAIDLARFETSFFLVQRKLPSIVRRIHARLMEQHEWEKLMEEACVSGEAKEEVQKIINKQTWSGYW